MAKIKVKYIGGALQPINTKWGGTAATNYAFRRSMQNNPDFELIPKFRKDFASPVEIRCFLDGADIIHVDDTAIITAMFRDGHNPPDVIGPITRSPLKDYQGWKAEYPADWFYRARVIRLNYAEERKSPELVHLIRHGVDTGMLFPVKNDYRRFILWAGSKERPAKNFSLMGEIVQGMRLPSGYEFRFLADYPVNEYWRLLDETAILINTSKYESFCCAAFEAMAKGVPVIWREGLQGGIHEAAGVRVPYNPEAYREKIMELLQGETFVAWGRKCREYCEQHASLAIMGNDLAAVYQEVGEKKQ